ncbi:MAG: CBS domain-containing protein [Dehalobacterium sp.]
MKVRDIMTENVEIVTPETSLEDVAKIMTENDIGCVPVCQNQTVLGMITDRDIIIRVIAKGKNPATTRAKDIMSTEIKTVSPDTDAHAAANIMSESQIKRLPVVENGKLTGILALGDLAIEDIHIDEAGNALSGISQGIQH